MRGEKEKSRMLDKSCVRSREKGKKARYGKGYQGSLRRTDIGVCRGELVKNGHNEQQKEIY